MHKKIEVKAIALRGSSMNRSAIIPCEMATASIPFRRFAFTFIFTFYLGMKNFWSTKKEATRHILVFSMLLLLFCIVYTVWDELI